MSGSSKATLLNDADLERLRQSGALLTSPTGSIKSTRSRLENRSDESTSSGSSKASNFSTATGSSKASKASGRSSNVGDISALTGMTDLSIHEEEIELPSDLISMGTLDYLGLSPKHAKNIHEAWNRDNTSGRNLCEFTKWYLRTTKGTDDRNDSGDWSETLRDMGAKEELIQGIMAPGEDNEKVRLTRSAMYWFLNAVSIRYEYLESIQSASKSRNAHAVGNQEPFIAMNCFVEKVEPGQRTKLEGKAGGCTTLYKGCAHTRAELMWDQPNRQGKLSLDSLVSDGGKMDFIGRGHGFFFTPDWEVAAIYCNFVKGTILHCGMAIIRIDVPNSILEDRSLMCYRAYYPSDAWKKSIFYSRRGFKLSGNFEEPVGANLIVATTSTGFPNVEDWRDITDKYVLYVDKDKEQHGIQYIFFNEVEDMIVKECKNKVWIYKPTAKKPEGNPIQHAPYSPGTYKDRKYKAEHRIL